MTSSAQRVVENVTCLACGCLCDDLTVHADGELLAQIEPSCPVCDIWYRDHLENGPTTEAIVNGRPTSLEVAIAAAAEILVTAKLPLVFGMAELSVESQRIAVALADELGAALDTEAPHDPMPAYFPTVGTMGCTWGEVIQRADLIVYWRCDPDDQPRHRERVLKRIDSNRSCKVVVIKDNWSLDQIWTLRALVQGKPVSEKLPEVILQFAADLQTARYAVIVYPPQFPLLVPLQALATDVNRSTRCRLISLGGPGNPTGRNEVVLWQTGFERSIGLHRGYPVSFGSEYSAEQLLTQEQVDVALILGNSQPKLGAAASAALQKLPQVRLCVGQTRHPHFAHVVLFAAVPGIHTAGTVFRSDRITLSLRAPFGSSLPDSALVLRRLLEAIRELNRTAR